MKQSNVARQWDMFIQGIDRRERIVKNRSLPCLSAARGRSSRNLSADYFTAIPAGERVPSSVDFVERGPGLPACRAYRASFLPLDWSAPSNWRSRKEKKRKKKASEDQQGERKGGRKREAERGGTREVNGERRAAVCCRHANSCWTATWKGLVGSSDLTARNLVSDTINIGPGELSQSRGSLSAASVNPADLKYPLCGFSPLSLSPSWVNRAVSEQPPFY